MFSGIVSEIGKIKNVSSSGSSARLEVLSEKTAKGIAIGDSVAVNGVCLTVVAAGKSLSFDVVGNTLKDSNLKRLRSGDPVNLENALKLGDPISGHMVTGHVDGERVIRSAKMTSKGWTLEIALDRDDHKYLVPKGSVAIDGVSLTIGETTKELLRIFLIPHTLESTTLKLAKAGSRVNVEFDMAAKYQSSGSSTAITEHLLREKGFL